MLLNLPILTFQTSLTDRKGKQRGTETFSSLEEGGECLMMETFSNQFFLVSITETFIAPGLRHLDITFALDYKTCVLHHFWMSFGFIVHQPCPKAKEDILALTLRKGHPCSLGELHPRQHAWIPWLQETQLKECSTGVSVHQQ